MRTYGVRTCGMRTCGVRTCGGSKMIELPFEMTFTAWLLLAGIGCSLVVYGCVFAVVSLSEREHRPFTLQAAVAVYGLGLTSVAVMVVCLILLTGLT